MNKIEDQNKLIAEFMGYQLKGRKLSDEMIYDTSWDWLMPVVEKVFVLSEDEEAWRIDIESGLTTLNRDETYRAVVEFIEHYNETK
jgi:hypothetical protein